MKQQERERQRLGEQKKPEQEQQLQVQWQRVNHILAARKRETDVRRAEDTWTRTATKSTMTKSKPNWSRKRTEVKESRRNLTASTVTRQYRANQTEAAIKQEENRAP